MTDNTHDIVVFDDALALVLARLVDEAAPSPDVKQRLMTRIARPPVPARFGYRYELQADWRPHPVPGIKMKVLSLNSERGYATLLLDVEPGTRFPAHRHTGGDEECYVVSGSLYTCGRHLVAGDFVHADAETEHGELWTDEGCRVILVVPPEDYMLG